MTDGNARSLQTGETQSIFRIFDLTGKAAIVTGAGRGLGKAMANALSQAHASVVIFDVNMQDAESAAAEIRAAGGQAFPAQIDVTDAQQVQAGINQAVDRYG